MVDLAQSPILWPIDEILLLSFFSSRPRTTPRKPSADPETTIFFFFKLKVEGGKEEAKRRRDVLNLRASVWASQTTFNEENVFSDKLSKSDELSSRRHVRYSWGDGDVTFISDSVT